MSLKSTTLKFKIFWKMVRGILKRELRSGIDNLEDLQPKLANIIAKNTSDPNKAAANVIVYVQRALRKGYDRVF